MKADPVSLRKRRIIGLVCVAVFAAVFGVTIYLENTKRAREGRGGHEIPVEELYHLAGMQAPVPQHCLLKELCSQISVNALSADASPIGDGLKQDALLQRLAETHQQSDLASAELMQLLPSEYQYLDKDGSPYTDNFIALISARGGVELDNIVGIACQETHCFAELGPLQDLGSRKAHIMVAFDRGRLPEWPKLAELVLLCVQQQCRKFK